MNEASTTWAFVVGIDQYDSPSVPTLQGAVADAVAAVSWLSKLGVPAKQILVNFSAEVGSAAEAAFRAVSQPHAAARQADIAASIHRLSQVVGGTKLLVFLCGHGFYEPSSGRMFLVQDFDTNGQWPNLGIDAYVQKFLSLPFRRQFLFMDGCLNYPYPEPMRPRFQAMGLLGEAPVTPLPENTMVTCFAASVSERALERKGRGLFLSILLPQLDPTNPVPAYPDAIAYSFDEGTASVDLYQLIDPFVSQRVRAMTRGAQNPRVFVVGAGESVEGAHPLFRLLPDPDTVAVSLTVEPPLAAADVERLSVWIDAPPFPSKYLYQPPPLLVPVQMRLPRGADGIATCNLPPAAPWDMVSARSSFRADADQTVSFTLTARPQHEPGLSPEGERNLWFGVKIGTRDGYGYGMLSKPDEPIFGDRIGYDEVAGAIGLPGPPADGQSIADGVKVTLHEDGPEFTAAPDAAEAGAETAAAWAGALRTVLPADLRVATVLHGSIAPQNEKLRIHLPPGGARRLAGPLARHPAVIIERGPAARPPAWRLTHGPASEPGGRIERILSLAELEQRPGIAIEPGPIRVSVELPWGSWTSTTRLPASGIEQVDLPATIGVPPLRVALADDLPYCADRDRSQQPVIFGLQGKRPEETLRGWIGFMWRMGRTDRTAPVVASPSGSASWGIAQPVLSGVLQLGIRPAILFPLAGRSLAVDRGGGEPRVEPLSQTSSAEWDLLIGAGQLEALETDDGLALAREADDELLRLACAYVLYARRDWDGLREALAVDWEPRHVGHADEALLQLAVAHSRGGPSESKDLAIGQVVRAADADLIPVLRWGIDLALAELTPEVLRRSPTIATWHARLASIRPRLSARSIWTTWTANYRRH